MSDEMIALGRRAVACKGWRWMSGMATAEGHRVLLVDDDVLWMVYNEEGKCKPGCVEDFVPDLSDPATLGCLLALVREAHGDPVLFARFRGARVRPDWAVSWDGSDVIATGATEAEALVAALESAP